MVRYQCEKCHAVSVVESIPGAVMKIAGDALVSRVGEGLNKGAGRADFSR